MIYLTPTQQIDEEQFLALCAASGYEEKFTNPALSTIYKSLEPMFDMNESSSYMERKGLDFYMNEYGEYSFEQLSEMYGHLVDDELKEGPFYRYHTAVLLAVADDENGECLINFFYGNPEKNGEDTYLITFLTEPSFLKE